MATLGQAFQLHLQGGWWQKMPLWQHWSRSVLPTPQRKGTAGHFPSALELQGRPAARAVSSGQVRAGPHVVSARKDGCPVVGKVVAAGLSV